ncbi:MAG: hypothetical protein JNL94_13295 [Planctomycetes bacterium]|nr:hypothetical protein [Planctomycetota bacterium]
MLSRHESRDHDGVPDEAAHGDDAQCERRWRARDDELAGLGRTDRRIPECGCVRAEFLHRDADPVRLDDRANDGIADVVDHATGNRRDQQRLHRHEHFAGVRRADRLRQRRRQEPMLRKVGDAAAWPRTHSDAAELVRRRLSRVVSAQDIPHGDVQERELDTSDR